MRAGVVPWSLVGKGEHFLASDVSAIVAHTRDAVYLTTKLSASGPMDSISPLSLAQMPAFRLAK